MSTPTPTLTLTLYVCDNCPGKPSFSSLDALEKHWANTHNVPMIITETDPWGERAPRSRQLFHVEVKPIG
jgi:hypothetical protein